MGAGVPSSLSPCSPGRVTDSRPPGAGPPLSPRAEQAPGVRRSTGQAMPGWWDSTLSQLAPGPGSSSLKIWAGGRTGDTWPSGLRGDFLSLGPRTQGHLRIGDLRWGQPTTPRAFPNTELKSCARSVPGSSSHVTGTPVTGACAAAGETSISISEAEPSPRGGLSRSAGGTPNHLWHKGV